MLKLIFISLSAPETMEEIIQSKFTNFNNFDGDYPSLQGLVDKSALPLPRSTRASTMITEKSHSGPEEEPKRFVMKKFQNVPGKLNLPSKKGAETKK